MFQMLYSGHFNTVGGGNEHMHQWLALVSLYTNKIIKGLLSSSCDFSLLSLFYFCCLMRPASDTAIHLFTESFQ